MKRQNKTKKQSQTPLRRPSFLECFPDTVPAQKPGSVRRKPHGKKWLREQIKTLSKAHKLAGTSKLHFGGIPKMRICFGWRQGKKNPRTVE